nr:CoA transferase [Paraburkholderia sp. BL8N3]
MLSFAMRCRRPSAFLDLTHVLAGPRSTQSLAELGAEVLHISSPLHADTLPQHLGVDMGKYCAYLDLTDADQLRRMHELAANADVFASTYRGRVAERFGLTPAELASRSSRGIVTMSVNAYGHSGPWANRAGFDPNGQAASGFASTEGDGVGNPKLSPVFYLADLISGYFAAAGMLAALLRRAREGGSYHVTVSLARSAMWVQRTRPARRRRDSRIAFDGRLPTSIHCRANGVRRGGDAGESTALLQSVATS